MNVTKTMSAIFLLSVLCSFASCGGGGEESVETDSATAVSSGLIALLPPPTDVPGWSMDGGPRFFNPGNLWEFINGAAEGYLTYGFEELVTADYSEESTTQQALIDIYRMRDALNAFGIYSQERNPEYDFNEIGAEGYLSGTALNFWSGAYYVKITVFEETDELKAEMAALAGNIAERIGAPGEEPLEVGYFPPENQISRGVHYIPRDILGQSYFTNGFEARYRLDDSEYKMVIVTAADPEIAGEGIVRYRRVMERGGKEVEELAEPGEGGFIGEDSFYGTVIAIRSGNRIAVILGAPSVEFGTVALTELVANM